MHPSLPRRLFLTAALLLLPLASLQAEDPFAFEKTPGQLPKEIVPHAYTISIAPDLKAATFTGSESIEIEVRAPVKKIVLNALELEISKATLHDAGQPARALIPQLHKETQTLSMDAEVAPGKYRLELEFRGKLNERPQGLYYTRYQSGSEEKRALSSQMEATDARRMFPCWDEPVYRATFQLNARLPKALTAVSNMPVTGERPMDDGTRELSFAPTPSMASYLLVLCASEFEELADEVEGIKLRIFTTPGKRDQARYAMEATKKILPFYHTYFGAKYPLPKLDQIAFTNTGASGMENWGAILYDETALLFDPATSSQATKERVFEVVAHEIAHQWFGNLVTMAWWDNLWLNEGFASWLGTKATDHFNPDWQCWLRAADSKEHAMHLDARSTTHPIQQPVANESQAGDAFDSITYSKGQAFLRMLESSLGEAVFRDGIRLYMDRHAYSNTTTADLWRALEEVSKVPVAKIAAAWTEQPGFPVVSVSQDAAPGSLRLAQESFTIRQKSPVPRLWQIPVMIGSLDGAAPAQRFWLNEKDAAVQAPPATPFKLNAGDVGYFRVAYDAPLFAQLLKSAPQWPAADRLNLLNDTWALVQAQRAPLERYLQLAVALSADTSYPVLSQIMGAFWFLDNLAKAPPAENALTDPGQRAAFQLWARTLLKPQLTRVGWEAASNEESLTPLLRSALVAQLGSFGDPGTLREARARFEGFVQKPASLTGDLRGAVLSVIGKFAGEGDWEQLRALLQKEPSTEQQRILQRAMARSPRPEDAAKTLALTLTDELIPPDAARLVQRVADEHPVLAWQFAQKHLDVLLGKVSSFGANQYVPGIFDAFSDASRAEELEAYAKASLPAGSANAVAKAADEIRFKSELKSVLLPAIAPWLKAASSEKR